jgi:hypothetical protein
MILRGHYLGKAETIAVLSLYECGFVSGGGTGREGAILEAAFLRRRKIGGTQARVCNGLMLEGFTAARIRRSCSYPNGSLPPQ